MNRHASLLVVAGEASGDRAAAGVVRVLRETLPLRAFGLGGAALSKAGMSLVGDLRDTTSMGIGAVAGRAGHILYVAARLVAAARSEKAQAALLVNYSEFNARLAPLLHAQGIRVVWYGAPQIWAWRRGRATSLKKHVDTMAVMLPFEEPLWREAGLDTHYVGHPAREAALLSRADARQLLGLTELAQTVAILPGSRPHEVDALLGPMLQALDLVRHDRASIDARVLLAPSLGRDAQADIARRAARYGIGTFEVDAAEGAGHVLPAFDVALTASGTATLEAALARAIPVVAYRVGLATELVARAFVRTESYGLPNVLLGRRVFPELLQRDVTPAALAMAVARTLDTRGDFLLACDAVLAKLGSETTPSRRVADLLRPWLVAT